MLQCRDKEVQSPSDKWSLQPQMHFALIHFLLPFKYITFKFAFRTKVPDFNKILVCAFFHKPKLAYYIRSDFALAVLTTVRTQRTLDRAMHCIPQFHIHKAKFHGNQVMLQIAYLMRFHSFQSRSYFGHEILATLPNGCMSHPCTGVNLYS